MPTYQELLQGKKTNPYENPAAKKAITISPSAAKKVNVALETAKYLPGELKKNIVNPAAELAQAVLTAPQRAIASLGIEAASGVLKIAGKKPMAEYQPKSKFEKLILGTEPIRPMGARIDEAQKKSQEVASKITKEHNVSTGASLAIAPLLMAGMTALDVTPIGGAEENIAKQAVKIAKSKEPQIVLDSLKTIFKNSDEELKPLVEKLVDMTNIKDVKNVIKGFKPEAVTTINDAEKYVKEMIAKREAARKAGSPGIVGKAANYIKELKTKFVDWTAPLEDTLRKAEQDYGFKVLPSQDINLGISRSLRARTLGGQFWKENAAPLIKGLTDKKAIDNVDNFEQYLIAKHAQDLEKTGVATGRNLEADKNLIAHFADKYEPYAQEFTNYSNKLLDYISDSGLVSKNLAEQLKKQYPNYVPFERIFSELEQQGIQRPGSKAVASLGQQTAIRKILGSEREIENPLASIMAKTDEAFRQGEKNKAAQMITSYKDIPNNPFGLRKITEDAPKKAEEGTISVLNNGVKETWAVNKDIEQAAKGLDIQSLGPILRALAMPTRIAKLGITGINLPFIVSNIARDQVTAAINADKALATSVANPVNFVKSLWTAIGHGKDYDEFVRNAAGGTSFDIARDQALESLEKLKSSRSFGGKIAYTIKNPSELLRSVEDIIGRSEELTRIQQYKGTKDALLKQGMSEADATAQAARAARENTVDFMRRGEYGSVMNSFLMYLNANIQGTRTFLRNFKNKPLQTATKIATLVYTPMALSSAWNMSDPKRRAIYEDIPEYEKQNNFIFIPSGNIKQNEDGTWPVIKIPISQEVSNIAQLPRYWIEKMYDINPMNITKVAQSLLGTVSPFGTTGGETFSALVPQILKPSLEVKQNKSLFTGLPIVPKSMENIEPKYQTKSYTSGTIRKLAGALGISPIQAEYWINGTFGSVTPQVINAIDQVMAALGQIPKDQIGGRTIIDSIFRRFMITQGGESERQTTESYSQFTQDVATKKFLEKQAMMPIYKQVQSLVDEGKEAEAQQVIDNLSDAQYATYKIIMKSEKLKTTAKTKPKVYDKYLQIQGLVDEGKEDEANKILNEMTDDEYKIYENILKTAEQYD